MNLVIVNVATGQYQFGQARLLVEARNVWPNVDMYSFNEQTGPGDISKRAWPTHQAKPYAFKAYALAEVAGMGYTKLLWCDACIRPGAASIERIWHHVEQHGVWLSRNGWSNYEWTADSAYPDLFPVVSLEVGRILNRKIEHVVATAFALDLDTVNGRAFFDEYYRLASETTAFCGPWTNTDETPCGPADVRGHRHDQTAASVIAWRLGIPLTEPPSMFAYAGGETADTVLIADGAY
jgi:hypothetical protein